MKRLLRSARGSAIGGDADGATDRVPDVEREIVLQVLRWDSEAQEGRDRDERNCRPQSDPETRIIALEQSLNAYHL
jgi:hypothetical protein